MSASAKQDNLFFAICQERKCKACRTAWLLEIKHLQNSGYWFQKKGEKKRGWGTRLWSQVVAPAHARWVFYCLLIIARLLLVRIYWSRQPAWLLSACEADTSCVTAARWGRRPLSLLGLQKPALFMPQRHQEQLYLPLGVKMDEAQLCLLLLYVLQEWIFKGFETFTEETVSPFRCHIHWFLTPWIA